MSLIKSSNEGIYKLDHNQEINKKEGVEMKVFSYHILPYSNVTPLPYSCEKKIILTNSGKYLHTCRIRAGSKFKEHY